MVLLLPNIPMMNPMIARKLRDVGADAIMPLWLSPIRFWSWYSK